MGQRFEETAGALGVIDHSIEVVQVAAGFRSLQFHSCTNLIPVLRDDSVGRVRRLSDQQCLFVTHCVRVQLFDERAQQAPKEILARISANAPDFAAAVDQHEDRRQPFDFNECQIRRHRLRSIDAAQRRPQAFIGLAIDRRDFAVKGFAPGATGAFEHHQFCGAGGTGARSNENGAKQRESRKIFQHPQAAR
ncbi:MAG TPA: hypothetical protein VFW22_12835 [Pseudolabrys sp.]|nr:hypothetical protein [Pseudolabrys sp.]